MFVTSYCIITVYKFATNIITDCGKHQRVADYGCHDVIMAKPAMMWHEANDQCTSIGRQLVNIETEQENNAIKEHLSQNAGNFAMICAKNFSTKRYNEINNETWDLKNRCEIINDEYANTQTWK